MYVVSVLISTYRLACYANTMRSVLHYAWFYAVLTTLFHAAESLISFLAELLFVYSGSMQSLI